MKKKLNKEQKLMQDCIKDSKQLMEVEGMAEYQSDVLGIALAFFRKKAGI